MSEKYRSPEQRIKDILEASLKTIGPKRTSYLSMNPNTGQTEKGHADAARRANRIELNRRQDQEKRKGDKEHEINRREEAADRRSKEGSVREEASAGTEARTKVKNVARLNDPEPSSPKSTLSRTAQIKSKIIEGNSFMYGDNKFGLSDSLINAVKSIVEGDAEKVEKKADKKESGLFSKDPGKVKGGKTKVNLEPEMDMKNVEEDFDQEELDRIAEIADSFDGIDESTNPYDAAHKEAKMVVDSRYHKTLANAVKKMRDDDADEAETLGSIHLGSGHKQAMSIFKKHNIG